MHLLRLQAMELLRLDLATEVVELFLESPQLDLEALGGLARSRRPPGTAIGPLAGHPRATRPVGTATVTGAGVAAAAVRTPRSMSLLPMACPVAPVPTMPTIPVAGLRDVTISVAVTTGARSMPVVAVAGLRGVAITGLGAMAGAPTIRSALAGSPTVAALTPRSRGTLLVGLRAPLVGGFLLRGPGGLLLL
jgi:hypothetical protein